MSIHKKVLRVTDEADDKTRAYAEKHEIGVYDAATALILAGLAASKQGAVSTWKVEIAETVKLSPEDAASVREFVERAPDPRVTAYAEERAMSYADALEFMITMADRRIQSLKKYAGKAKAA